MKIIIDMTSLKPMKTGGIEFYAFNLLKSLIEIDNTNTYLLLCAKDNIDYFKKKFTTEQFEYVLCKTNSNNTIGHLLWQIFKENKIIKKLSGDIVFFPSYLVPPFGLKRYNSVVVVHDIRFKHYTYGFSRFQLLWLNYIMKRILKTSRKIVAITDYTKLDIENNYKHKDNITFIYNPIIMDNQECVSFPEIADKYGINKNDYYYTVSSMHEHKNLITLLNLIKEINEKEIKGIPNKLVISGVGGPSKENFYKKLKELKIEDKVILTDFISNEERNTLMKNCNAFLFPSIFEGFGMPPIEALKIGSRVITTKETALPEVTMNRCNYVSDPYGVNEWIDEIKKVQNIEPKNIAFPEFDGKVIAEKYLSLFDSIVK